MSIDKIEVPKDLMKNVENRLRKHVENKKKRLRIYAVAAAVSMALILPVSAYAYNKYYNEIPFKQEIDLARQNNNITKVDKTFKYKNVDFKIKEIVADETGMEIIYDVSNPRYAIDGVGFTDVNGNSFGSGGSSYPDVGSEKKERALYLYYGKNAAEYMYKNPIRINFNTIIYNSSKNDSKLVKKINSLMGIKEGAFKVDWNLKMKVPMQPMKTIAINKEYDLNIGKLKLKSIHEGVLKSILEYDFISSDKNISRIEPLFSIRMDKEYTSNACNMENGGQHIISSMGFGTEEFKSIYYKRINEIGIRLIGAAVDYSFQDTKEYEISKDKLPMDVEFNGEKFKVVSIEEKENSIDYNMEFSKNNRIYNNIHIMFGGGCGSSWENEKVEFKDQAERDKIYNDLIKKVPDLKSIYSNAGYLGSGMEKAIISTKINCKDKTEIKFRVDGATRSFLYDTDEVVIKP